MPTAQLGYTFTLGLETAIPLASIQQPTTVAITPYDTIYSVGLAAGIEQGFRRGIGAARSMAIELDAAREEARDDGYWMGFAAGVNNAPPAAGFNAPTMTVLATFAADFSTAHMTQWSASLANVPKDATLIILVREASRNEVLVARDAEGTLCWPFDVEPDNSLVGTGTVAVTLRPRGGWPKGKVEIQIAAAKMAQVV